MKRITRACKCALLGRAVGAPVAFDDVFVLRSWSSSRVICRFLCLDRVWRIGTCSYPHTLHPKPLTGNDELAPVGRASPGAQPRPIDFPFKGSFVQSINQSINQSCIRSFNHPVIHFSLSVLCTHGPSIRQQTEASGCCGEMECGNALVAARGIMQVG